MAGFGSLHGDAHGLDIAHLTDEDDIGRLAHGILERRPEAVGVNADLALADDALLVAVHVLDRILDGDDVGPARAVDHVNHGRQRRGLPAASRPRNQDQALRVQGDLVEHQGQVEVFDGEDIQGDQTHDQTGVAALAVDVDAQAAHTLDGQAHVLLVVVLEAFPIGRAHQGLGDAVGVLRREHRELINVRDDPAQLAAGVAAGLPEDVRGLVLVPPADDILPVIQRTCPPDQTTVCNLCRRVASRCDASSASRPTVRRPGPSRPGRTRPSPAGLPGGRSHRGDPASSTRPGTQSWSP